jgi:hypothetical protein
LNEAVARLGRPDAARVMGLDRPPCNCVLKVKLAEAPETTFCVVVPVGAKAKSGEFVWVVLTVSDAAVEVLGLKFASPE